MKRHVEFKLESEVIVLVGKSANLELLEKEYLSKILGFSYLKTNTKEDAEDLSGEIVLQIIKYIQSDKKIENLNAFVWRVSNNTLCKWLRSKKYSNTMYLTELIPSDEEVSKELLEQEELVLLKREISLLSKSYRESIVLHYFEGKSCEEIAYILKRSAGTIKWWLYDARKFIKEGMNKMREYGEKSYKPAILKMSCQCNPGVDNEPISCVTRKSTQNILLAAYKEAMSIEELCIELGISAPYIEDEVKYLVDNQLMKEVSKKYQTDFVIVSGKENNITEQIYNKCFPGYYDELMNLLEDNKSILIENTADFEWERLLWMYIHLITDINLCKFKNEACGKVAYNDIPDRPNGGKWIALGFENDFPFVSVKKDYKEYQAYDGPVHKGGNDKAQGFFHYWSGLDSRLFFDIPEGVFALCRQIIKGEVKISELTEDQKLLFSVAVEKNLFIKVGESFKQNYCYITDEQIKLIIKINDEFYNKASIYFEKAWNIVIDKYKNEVPKHLHWQMGNLLSNHLNIFVTCSLYEAERNNILSVPEEQGKEWLSLFAIE